MVHFKNTIAFVVVLIVFLLLTLRPSSDALSIPIPHFDKLAHIGFFSVMAFFLILSLDKETFIKGEGQLNRVVCVISLLLLGGGVEFLQADIPGRSASFADGVADFVGSILGLALYKRIGN